MPRPEVLRYAETMEQKLQVNDEEKGTTGWRGCKIDFLLNKLDEEVGELRDISQGLETFKKAMILAAHYSGRRTPEQAKAIEEIKCGLVELLGKEAADVGNIAMMISDVCGALREDAI